MLILADLGHDPKHWPSEAATAADQSDDRGALLARGGRDSGRQIGGVWEGGAPRKAVLVSPGNHRWRSLWKTHDINENLPHVAGFTMPPTRDDTFAFTACLSKRILAIW